MPVRLARDGHHIAIDRRRERAVDRKLRLAGGLALLERGEIEEGKAHRALDLERAPTGEEDRGGVGVDARHRLAAVGRRVGQEIHHGLLVLGCVHYRPIRAIVDLRIRLIQINTRLCPIRP